LQRRDPTPPPPRDEDDLDHEPVPVPVPDRAEESVGNGLDKDHIPSRIYANPYSVNPANRPPLDTRPVGPVPVGTQLEFNWPSFSRNYDLCCWSEGRPPRLVVSNNDEDQTHGRDDETPPQAAE
jgi:hypothetical protein